MSRRQWFVLCALLALAPACGGNSTPGIDAPDGSININGGPDAGDAGPDCATNPCLCCTDGQRCIDGKTCCTPKCADRECGDDGCGDNTECGDCKTLHEGDWTCDTTHYRCQCAPESDADFCAASGQTCGTLTAKDNCGQLRTDVDCSVRCASPKSCHADGTCSCDPENDTAFCTRLNKACGAVTADDNCGASRTVADCGQCNTGFHCDANACVCTPVDDAALCASHNASCGTLATTDNCSAARTVQCGTCPSDKRCDSTNTCVCKPETDAELCFANAKQCDALQVTDRCGVSRSITSCGTCGAGEVCTPNGQCLLCTPESNIDFCSRHGAYCGTVADMDNCGIPRSPSCGSCYSPETCQPNNACGDGIGPTNDSCLQPLQVALTAGANGGLTANIHGDTTLAADNLTPSCVTPGSLGHDLVYKVTIPPGPNRSVQMVVTPSTGSGLEPSLSIRTSCDQLVTELGCAKTTSLATAVPLAVRNLMPGDYFIIVDQTQNYLKGPFELEVTLAPVPAVPANDTCSAAQALTLTNGTATATGSLVSAVDNYTGSCGAMTGGEVVYSFTLSAGSAVTAIVTRDPGSPALLPAVYFRGDCASSAAADELACATSTNGAAVARAGYLPAGTYYVIVDATDGTFGTFSLQLNATAPVGGDTCAIAMPMLIDPVTGLASITGDTTNATDDVSSTCAASPTGRDLVYELHVPGTSAMRTEIQVVPSGTGITPALSLRRTCGDAATEIACVKSANPVSTTLAVARLQPGAYYLWVDGTTAGANGPFGLNVTATQAPPPPTNDQCSAAQALTLNAGGTATVTGTTANAYDDSQGACSSQTTAHAGGDVVYALTLPAGTSNVAVSVSRTVTSPTFRPAVYLRATCGDAATEKGCANESSGTAAATFANLTAGTTYYVIVDGIAATEGEFTLTAAAYGGLTNDTCATAQTLTFDSNGDAWATNTTYGAASDAYSAVGGPCAGVGTGGDLVYLLTLGRTQNVRIDVTPIGLTYQPVVFVRRTACTSTALTDELSCSKATVQGAPAALNLHQVASGTYWIWVDTSGAYLGPYAMHVHLSDPPPPATNDLCSGATALTFDGTGLATATGDLEYATGNYDGSCKPASGMDLVYAFSLTQTKGIQFTVTPTTGALKPVIYVNSACGGTSATEKGCTAMTSVGAANLTIPALLAGTYYVVVDTYGTNDVGAFTLTAQLTSPPPPPSNDVCSGATLLTWSGNTATATDNTTFASDDERSYCSVTGAVLTGPDLVYKFTLSSDAQVTAKVTRATGNATYKPAVSIRSTCTAANEVVCARDAGAGVATAIVSLAAGTYYVFVDGVSSSTSDSAYGPFTLELTQQTLVVADGCGNPQPITIDPATGIGTVTGTTATAVPSADDPVCNAGASTSAADLVYSLTLSREMTVQVSLANPVGVTTFYPNVYMRRTCADPNSEVSCDRQTNGVTAAGFLIKRLPAGTYFIWVDSYGVSSQGAFVLTVTTSVPSQPPAANDTCASPQVLVIDGPNGGAQVVADTGWGLDDYAGNCSTSPLPHNGSDLVYKFTLAQAATVYASIARHPTAPTTFFPALYLRTSCSDPSTEVACMPNTTTAGATTSINQLLQAGTYYLFVEGLRGSAGLFVLNVGTAPATPIPNDTCATAKVLTFDANGVAVAAGSTQGLTADYTGSCYSSTAPDAVYTFTLTTTKRVTIDMDPAAATTYPLVYVQTTCGSAATEKGCAYATSANGAEIYLGSLAAGTYYVIADAPIAANAGPFTLAVRAENPPPPPANDVCTGAQVIAIDPLTGKGSVTGNTQDGNDDYTSYCSTTSTPLVGPDLVYKFTLTADAAVTAKVTRDPSNSLYKPAISLRTTCAATDEIACARDTANTSTVTSSLAAGTYYVFVDGVNSGTAGSSFGPFTLELSTGLVVVGDSCGNAIALNPDRVTGVATVTGDLSLAGNSGDGSCAASTGTDYVYSLTLTQPKAVKVTMANQTGSSATLYPNVYMRRACADPNAELGCASATTNTPISITMPRVNPGTYYIFADATNAGGQGQFQLTVELTEPTGTPPANDTCATAQTIVLDPVSNAAHIAGDTSYGGNDFAGSCATSSANLLAGPDVVYAITLAQPGTLYAVVNKDPAELKTYYPGLYLRSVCNSSALADELACGATTNNNTASFSRDLPAGTYYLIVDGVKAYFGKFLLDVVVRPSSAMTNDTCAGAQPIPLNSSGVGIVAGSTANVANDGTGSCQSSSTAPDVVYSITTTATKNITIDMMGGINFYPLLYVRTSCSDSASQIGCDYKTTQGIPSHLELLNKPAGTYYIWADAYSTYSGLFTLMVKVTDPPPVPANDTCAGAQAITLPAPGAAPLRISGTTYASANDLTGSCASTSYPFDGPDNVYTFTTTAPTFVSAKVTPVSYLYKAALYIRSTCATAGTDKCLFSSTAGPGYPVGGGAVLPAGTWYLIVDGVGATMGDYLLEVSTANYTGVGATATQLNAYTASPGTVYGMTTDASEVLYNISGSSVGAVAKAGGTPYSKGTGDGLTSEIVGYDLVEAGGSVFSLDTGTSNTTGRLWKIKDASTGWLTAPVRWDVPNGVTTSTWPTTALYAFTTDGTDIILAGGGTSSTAPVAFYAVSASYPELPRALGTATLVYYARGIAADANYFYVAGTSASSGSGVWRFDRLNLNATPVKLAETTTYGTTHVAVRLSSLTSPQYLYARSPASGSAIMVIDSPASATPSSLGALMLPGVGTNTNYGMTYDRQTNTLYYFETATSSPGVLWKVQ